MKLEEIHLKQFKEIGYYSLEKDDVIREKTDESINITDRAFLVYILIYKGDCMYIGKTKQGYARPLRYHKNNVMKDVRDGIKDVITQNGGSVNIICREFKVDDKYSIEGLNLNIYSAYEEALIKKYDPKWNNQK